MKLLPVWLRTLFRAKQSPARRIPLSRSARLDLETLEDRIQPSVSYTAWRQTRYTVNDLTPAQLPISSQFSSYPTTGALAANPSFGPLIGLDKTFNSYAYRGQGYTVAILDTGIDYRHPDLGGGFGAGYRVVAGYDYANGDSNPLDDNGHGTHVAGIIGGAGAAYTGIAPNVRFIALKVLDKNGSGTFGAVDDALRWVVANQAKYNIVAVNMSLGAGNYTTNPYTFLDANFASLKSKGVFITTAAGNDFYTYSSQQGLTFPAIDSLVVSVGAVWSGNFGSVTWASGARDNTTAADRIASFSQRGAALDLFAPGAIITSTYLSGGYQAMAGTSMASPVVAGAAILIHQALDARGLSTRATQDYIISLMRNTGVRIVDGDDENDNVQNTGMAFRRLNLSAALAAIGGANAAPTLGAIATQTMAPGRSRVVMLQGADLNGDALTYTARVVSGSAGLAYTLDQQYGLFYAGSYYVNLMGANEKWIAGAGGAWFLILPNGELRRWNSTLTATQQPASLVGTLSTAYYDNPALLYNALPAGATPGSVSISGNRLTITSTAGTTGTFVVDVSVSDGQQTVKKSFTVSVVPNTTPSLSTLASLPLSMGQSATIALSAVDAESDPVAYAAALVGTFASVPATLSVVGGQLTINPAAGYSGGFDVRVVAFDGSASSSTTFRVTVNAETVLHQLVGDFNGDGRSDIATFNTNGSWWVNLSNGASFVSSQWSQWVSVSSWKSIMVGDVNGDRRADLIAFNRDGSWWVARSTGSSFATAQWTQWIGSASWNKVMVGDFNGDRKADIVGFNNDGGWWVGLSTGSSFATGQWSQWIGASRWNSVFVGDFNGDGWSDVAGFNNDGGWWIAQSQGGSFATSQWSQWIAASRWASVQVGDFNGDGRTDVSGFNNDGGWWVGLSQSTRLATSQWSQWIDASNWASVRVGDFNGDGVADVAGLTNGGTWWVGASSGGRFATSQWLAAPDGLATLLAADFTGDRRKDLIGFRSDGTWWVGASTGRAFVAADWARRVVVK